MATKQEILTRAFEMRVQEVLEYQINIDNYTIALAAIDQDESMLDFKNQLQDLLTSSIREQKKSKIIMDAIKVQLDSMNTTS
jgi:hypothetical protein